MVGPGRQERSWIRGARAGSVSDLEALFREHWPRAHRAAYLVVQDAAAAEDIAQEAFLSALRNLDRFDRRRPFGPWLHRIVVNRSIDWARTRALRRELSEVPGSEDFDTGDLGTFSEGVAAGLASLPPDQRAVIVLRYLLEYTPGEIADMLELPRGTVNSRLRLGLEELDLVGILAVEPGGKSVIDAVAENERVREPVADLDRQEGEEHLLAIEPVVAWEIRHDCRLDEQAAGERAGAKLGPAMDDSPDLASRTHDSLVSLQRCFIDDRANECRPVLRRPNLHCPSLVP